MPNSLRSYSLVGYGGGKLNEKVDCKVSHWKHEVCNATCGEGYQSKYRSIIVSFYDTDDDNKSRDSLQQIFSLFYKLTATSTERRSSLSTNDGKARAMLQRLWKFESHCKLTIA